MDREKVISDLQEQIDWIRDNEFHKFPGWGHAVLAMKDAIALLKEQEPKQVEAEVINEIDRFYRCPSCHISMILRKQPYCHSCGQAVKWE